LTKTEWQNLLSNPTQKLFVEKNKMDRKGLENISFLYYTGFPSDYACNTH